MGGAFLYSFSMQAWLDSALALLALPQYGLSTLFNTLGGMLDWWMGFGAHQVVDKYGHSKSHVKALAWLERLGPRACLLSWLPLVGDPLCAVAGWLKLPFWPCAGHMLVGNCCATSS